MTISEAPKPPNRRQRPAIALFILGTALLLFTPLAEAQPPLQEIFEQLQFREIGPTRPGGRVVAFAVAASDPYVFFVAAGPGGLWKTVNNGTTFEPVFDHQAVASIGDVAVAPSDEDIVWVGTGEANLRSSTYYGNGVYRSLDGGSSWEQRGLDESHHIGRVLIHPSDPKTVYVAAQGHLYSENPERGVYKTTDGGATWKKSLGVEADGRNIGATEIVMDPSDPNTLFAVAYDRQRFPWSLRIAGPGSGIYKSTNAGATWRKLTTGLPGGMLGKIGIDVYLRDPKIVYATVDNQNSPGVSDEFRRQELFAGARPSHPTVGHEIYRSDNAGESWRKVSPPSESIGSRSNYYGQIVVDPNDPNHLYVLGMRVWESHDGGRSWSHEIAYGGDHHALWIDPRDSRRLLLGYDYGMAISHDTGANWYHPDELSMAQVYAVGVDMDSPYNVYCGLQDFGSWKGPSTKKGRFPIRFEDWEHVNGGDGFYNRVDPSDSRWLYSGSQFGHITRIDQRTGQRKTIVDDERLPYRFNWNTPVLLSPHDPERLFVGGNRLLRSDNRGDDWEAISPDLTRHDATKFDGVGAVRYATITTIDTSPIEAGTLWVGTDDGNLQLSRDGGETWTDRSAALSAVDDIDGYGISRIEASPHRIGSAYVTISGFHHDDFRPFVYTTSDFGASWTSIAAGLPVGSVNVIQQDRVNSDLLFVGTDRGVFASLDNGQHWTQMRSGLPTIPVHDLVVHPRENDLVLGTHGRGVFITNISPLQELTTELLGRTAHLFRVEPQTQWVMTSQPAVSAQNFAGANEPYGVQIYFYLRDAAPDGVTLRIWDDSELLHEAVAPAGTDIQSPDIQSSVRPGLRSGLHRFDWGMSRRRARTDEQKVSWDEEQQLLAEDIEFFDYYDTVEVIEPGDEVDRLGWSLRTRVHQPPGRTDREYAYYRVSPGEYRATLTIGDELFERRLVLRLDDRN